MAEDMARLQAKDVATEIAAEGGPAGLENKEIVALVAYLQRLGTDIKKGGLATASGAAPAGGAPAETRQAEVP